MQMASYHFEIKSGRKGAAAEHCNYIGRQGRHGRRDDLLLSGYGNLPEWAGNNPRIYWAAADMYERANGATYREMIIALPQELDIP